MNNNVDTTKTITHLSLCSGYEGIGRGIRTVFPNLREIAYVEREGFPIANLVAKMETGDLDAAPIFTDVKTFPYGKFRGCVDILSGGFPCQPFSNAGKRQATEDPRHLFPSIANGIKECQPRIVFLENVAGIISCKTGDGEPVLQYVIRTLEGLGYRATAGIFSAEEVGAPHQRKRVYILGIKTKLVYSNSNGYSEHSATKKKESNWRSETATFSRSKSITELADSNSSRGKQDRMSAKLWSSGIVESSINRWPCRPREAQQKWEEKRVIPDTKSKQGSPGNNGKEQRAVSQSKQSESGGRNCRSLRKSNGQAESKLGGATDGIANGVDATANRVDRLRLCGNGVVPQTAAKAFVTLINRIVE